MIATLSGPRRLVAGTPGARSARGVRRSTRSPARVLAATDHGTPVPCLGLALVVGAVFWVALGEMVFLLVG
jgi:hypothetical protein